MFLLLYKQEQFVWKEGIYRNPMLWFGSEFEKKKISFKRPFRLIRSSFSEADYLPTPSAKSFIYFQILRKLEYS